MQPTCLFAAFFLSVLSLVQLGIAQEIQKDADATNGLDSGAKSKPTTISVDQEKEVLAFVSKNDASLHDLLSNLKSAKPTEYQRALMDLNRATERLSQIKRNRPHAYELELKKWQTQSKIQMLAVQLAMNPNPETKAELRKAFELRADLELQVLRADREAATKRLKQLDDQIAAAEANRWSRVQMQFDRSIATANRAKGAAQKKRPALDGKKPATKKDIAPEGSTKQGAKG